MARERGDERVRSPIVTILGHVDHGKTSLLDRIRKANVAAGEAGGITQATSAFQVPVTAARKNVSVTFIDTPGHEAFTNMRARGAKVTDVVVLVVAADDGIMPQTAESISHAKAAGVPLVVALNKIDKAEATEENIQRIFGQLAEHELNPTEWGGSTEVIKTSAIRRRGHPGSVGDPRLSRRICSNSRLTSAAMPKERFSRRRSKRAEARWPRMLVQEGMLKKGDFIVTGRGFGRVRDIVDDHGKRVDLAGAVHASRDQRNRPVPDAGDRFFVADSLKEAESAAEERAWTRTRTGARGAEDHARQHLRSARRRGKEEESAARRQGRCRRLGGDAACGAREDRIRRRQEFRSSMPRWVASTRGRHARRSDRSDRGRLQCDDDFRRLDSWPKPRASTSVSTT